MYKPFYIKGSDWGPFENFEYFFENGAVTVIQGCNKTDPGSKSNESGKSWFFGAMSYVITGDPIRPKVTKKDLVRKGCKESYLEMLLKNDETNGSLLIKRRIPARGSETVEVEINSIKQEYASVNDYNKSILDEIGICREDILNFFLVSKDKWKSFFSSSDADKKDLIGRFSKADLIDGVDEDIKADIKKENEAISAIDEKIKGVESNKNSLEIEKARYESKLETLNINLTSSDDRQKFDERVASLKKSVNDQLKEIKTKRELIPQKISEANKRIGTLKISKKIEEDLLPDLEIKKTDAQNRYDMLSKVSYDPLYAEFAADKNRNLDRKQKGQEFVRSTNSQLSSTRNTIADIEAKIKGAVTCPLCSGQFSLQNKLSVDDLKSQLSKESDALYSLSSTVSKYEAAIVEIDKILYEYAAKEREISEKEDNDRKQLRAISLERDGYISDIQRINSKLLSYDRDIKHEEDIVESYNRSLSSLDSEKSTYQAKLTEIGKMEYEDKSELVRQEMDKVNVSIKEVTQKIADLDKSIESIMVDRKTHEDEIFEMKSWMIRFTQFYSHLTNKALSVISNQMNQYLDKFGTDIRVEFEGYTVKADGTLSEKLNPIITRKNGLEEWSYGSLSGGGRARLEAASILGNSTLINTSTGKGKGLDLIGIDEVLESIDGHSMTNMIDSISEILKTVFIVTHVDIDDSFKKILVTKENGVSRMETFN